MSTFMIDRLFSSLCSRSLIPFPEPTIGRKMISDSMAPAAGPRYIGFSLAGIIGSEGPIARRHQAVLKVFEQLDANSVINIQAPPFSGKSSLAEKTALFLDIHSLICL